jgi:Fe-S-cluster containining protein
MKNKECQCEKCKDCCWHSPGWFGNIKEVKGAAKIMGLSVSDFCKQYLIREWWAGKNENIEIPAPRRNPDRVKYKEWESVRYFRDKLLENGKGFLRATWSHNLILGFACVFLDKDNLCLIHKSKPMECKKVFGCKEGFKNNNIRESIILEYWKKHQDFIKGIK